MKRKAVALYAFMLIATSGCTTKPGWEDNDFSTLNWLSLEEMAKKPSKMGVALAPPGTEPVQYEMFFNSESFIPVTMNVTSEEGKTYHVDFKYADRPEFNYNATVVLAPDGSQKKSSFSCGPRFPDTRNEGGCFSHLRGYDLNVGGLGVLFGTSLITGLDPNGEGVVERPLKFATRLFNMSFQLSNAGDNLIQIAPLKGAFDASSFVNFNHVDPDNGCNILSGVIMFNTEFNIPVACRIIPDEEDVDVALNNYAGWNLKYLPNSRGRTIKVDLTNLADAPDVMYGGRIMPAPDNEEAMPFGFYEALDYASENNEDVRQFLMEADYLLYKATLSLAGSTTLGNCSVVCTEEERWEWEILLSSPTEGLSLVLSAAITEPGSVKNVSIVDVQSMRSPEPYPEEIGRLTYGAGQAWEKSTSSTGAEPVIMMFQPHEFSQGQAIEHTIESYYCCPPSGGGYPPYISLTRTGDILSNLANELA